MPYVRGFSIYFYYKFNHGTNWVNTHTHTCVYGKVQRALRLIKDTPSSNPYLLNVHIIAVSGLVFMYSYFGRCSTGSTSGVGFILFLYFAEILYII